MRPPCLSFVSVPQRSSRLRGHSSSSFRISCLEFSAFSPMSDEPLPHSEIILYQTEDGRTRIQCRFENETVWLTQAQMADLFQRERSVITRHIRKVFEEGELAEEAVCANDARTAADGKTYRATGRRVVFWRSGRPRGRRNRPLHPRLPQCRRAGGFSESLRSLP